MITGMPAALASPSTVSQPVSTSGENAITSTLYAMKERIALIWFSGSCMASSNMILMPASLAALMIEWLFCVRQVLSSPSWE